jgi:nucleoside-triphosphatase
MEIGSKNLTRRRILNSKIYFLTGKINEGKTTTLQKWLKIWEKRKLRVGGIVAIAKWKSGIKHSYEIHDIETGKSCLFAAMEKIEDGISMGRFNFSIKGIAFAEKVLLRNPSSLDILIVDEIGPLEISGRGLAKALEMILHYPPKNLILVVRESLAERVADAFKIKKFKSLKINHPCPFSDNSGIV